MCYVLVHEWIVFLFQPNKQMFRSFILLFGGLMATFGSRAVDISGAGALGCLTLAFVAAAAWRKEEDYDEEVKITCA